MGKKDASKIGLALLLLVIGGGIYLLMRQPVMLMHKVAADLGIGAMIEKGRMLVCEWQLPEWILYSLPGALWATAYILIIDALLSKSPPWRRFAVAAFIPLVGIVSELLQFLGFLPGTFDAIDIVAYALPLLIYAIAETINYSLFTFTFFTLFLWISQLSKSSSWL